MNNTERQYKKAKFIVGSKGSGKSKLAKTIAESYEHPIKVNGKVHVDFLRLNIPSNADLVIINKCPKDLNLEFYFSVISGGINICSRGGSYKMIYPHFIFLSKYLPIVSGVSFDARFDLIRTEPQINWNYIAENYPEKYDHFQKWLYSFLFKKIPP